MPHQCVRCSTLYGDGSVEILNGCSCGSKLFFYIKQNAFEKRKSALEQVKNLSKEQKEQIEEDVFDLIGVEKGECDYPVILDMESINIVEPGKFELDLVKLFNKKNPLVYKLEDGKYIIDLAETFKRDFDEILEE